MFRLAGWEDKNALENELYVYLSKAISNTIIDCLDRFSPEKGAELLYIKAFGNDFFYGLSQYIKPNSSSFIFHNEDDQVGYEFTLSKMKRMKEKMLDPQHFYTFDLFEERILYDMCDYIDYFGKDAYSKKVKKDMKEKRAAAQVKLMETFQLSTKKAKDYSKKMYYMTAMPLKDDEDNNLIFWDDDYLFFWEDGFISGIQLMKNFTGEKRGYGYHYACDIFSDIGMKPPLRLLGTEEGNKIATAIQREQYNQAMDSFTQNILQSSKDHEDPHKKHSDGDEDEDLPFK